MSATLEVKLLGKAYRVACGPDEREELMAAVEFLDGRLQEISEKTRGSSERIAIMAAVNLAHEFLAAKNTPADVAAALESESIQRRIESIEAKLDESLAQHEQLF
ncbi:MAG: cell division protein ZapA [Burkholderiaceae bacterium]|nr:cell division protein ZapA [Sulfuritalea sp.]MCF8176693.1 cell division protein ZapA [Burkholderiaceae bacterium]MCF8184671.1 cell division protein ZapA [Polynucleobacter sp.]